MTYGDTVTVPVLLGNGMTIYVETRPLGGREQVGAFDGQQFQDVIDAVEIPSRWLSSEALIE